MSRSEKLERFSAGEGFAVHPDTIEGELSRLWQEAGRSTGDLQPVTRACLWNVVFILEERPGYEGAAARSHLERAINTLPARLANRSLILRTRATETATESLSSYISANCVLDSVGGKQVCSEEVTLVADETGQIHLPGLVRALLVPGVPTAVVFGGLPTPDSVVQADLIKLADRVVTALDWSNRHDELAAARTLFEGRPLYGMDLGWVRQAELRDEIAHRFEPPCGLDWRQVSRVSVQYPAEKRGSAKLLAGWVASALGASSVSKIETGGRALLGGGRPLELNLEAGERMAVTFAPDSGPTTTVEVGHESRPLDEHLGLALAVRRQDQLLADALRLGAHL